jgi:hypothetical protein
MNNFDIPIFKKIYELYKVIYCYREKVSKMNRYALWQRCENLILDIAEKIIVVTDLSKEEKLPILKKISLKLNILRMFIRLSKELRVIDNKKYIYFQEIIDEIGRMLGGWIRSIKNSLN